MCTLFVLEVFLSKVSLCICKTWLIWSSRKTGFMLPLQSPPSKQSHSLDSHIGNCLCVRVCINSVIMLHCAPHCVDISHSVVFGPLSQSLYVRAIVVSVDLLCYSSHIPLDQSSHSHTPIILIHPEPSRSIWQLLFCPFVYLCVCSPSRKQLLLFSLCLGNYSCGMFSI